MEFELAPQTYTKHLEDEMQEIYQALVNDPNKTMLVTDESRIFDVSDQKEYINRVKTKLGIDISPNDTFVEAALKLISHRKQLKHKNNKRK